MIRANWSCLLAAAAILAGAMNPAMGAKMGDPIPGFSFVNGVYHPNVPKPGDRRATGLQQPFPEMKSVKENPITPEKVALGKLLYFDPILSGENNMSCATCHHPDYGFSDGRGLSMGFKGVGVGPERKDGHVIPRSAPTVWNAAFYETQFWDGRAKDLEEQAAGPIQSPDEMGENPENLVKELRAIPEYVKMFEAAFGASGPEAVNFGNVTKAIGTFERTILSVNSKFDRYAAGDSQALNESEKRGLQLFRSLKTRCFECHSFPNFSDSSFRVLGVPDLEGQAPDVGRAKVPGQGPEGAFKVPTLRNVALNAPYMHNGKYGTLEEVVEFYSKGGGHQFQDNNLAIDDKIGTFDITAQEKADLVAFMKALTDTSLLPEAPTSVPSGLPVHEVKSKPEPAPEPRAATIAATGSAAPAPAQVAQAGAVGGGTSIFRAASLNRPAAAAPGAPVTATFTIMPGQSIQAAVDRAQPGDRIEVYPGIYHQSIVADRDGLNLIGININGERPILDGRNTLADAVQGSGNDFLIQGFHVRNYTGNGIVNNKCRNVTYRDIVAENAGLYAVYPVECVGVLVEGCVVSGTKDAGIYVGQSRNIVVRNNEVFQNVAGIEIENSVNALVENNSAHHNTCGILVFVLPNNPSKVGSHVRVINNRSWENNHPNFAKKGTIVSFLPPGLGMLIMAADHTEVTQNQIWGNDSQGVQIMSFLSSQTGMMMKNVKLDIEPNSDNTFVHGNIYRDNGKNPASLYAALKIPGGDISWDATGVGNGFNEAPGVKTYPPELPKQSGIQKLDFSAMGIGAGAGAGFAGGM